VLGGALGVSNNAKAAAGPDALDESRKPVIQKIDDIAIFRAEFYFGSEEDDPTVAYGLHDKVNPIGGRVNASWASDSGHLDVRTDRSLVRTLGTSRIAARTPSKISKI